MFSQLKYLFDKCIFNVKWSEWLLICIIMKISYAIPTRKNKFVYNGPTSTCFTYFKMIKLQMFKWTDEILILQIFSIYYSIFKHNFNLFPSLFLMLLVHFYNSPCSPVPIGPCALPCMGTSAPNVGFPPRQLAGCPAFWEPSESLHPLLVGVCWRLHRRLTVFYSQNRKRNFKYKPKTS